MKKTKKQREQELVQRGIDTAYHQLFIEYIDIDYYLSCDCAEQIQNAVNILAAGSEYKIKNFILADLLQTKLNQVIEHSILGLNEVVELHFDSNEFDDL